MIYIEERKSSKYLFIMYLFLSFFEGYINQIFFPLTKYLTIIVIIYYGSPFFAKKHKIPIYTKLIVAWLFFKNISLLWGAATSMGTLNHIKVHFYSQILMVVLFFVISINKFRYDTAIKIINSYYYLSGLLSFLAIFFSQPYHEDFVARQTLTILGFQMDPNDLSIFYLCSVVISFYKIIARNKKKAIDFILLPLGLLAMLLTGSRGGFISLLLILPIGIIFAISDQKSNYKEVIKTIFFLIIILISLFIFFKFYGFSFLPQETFSRLFVNSYSGGSGRVNLWRNAIKYFSERPFIGFGWGARETINLRIHNTYLNMLVDTGLLGFFPFLFAVIFIIYEAYKKGEYLSILILLASLFPCLFVEGITKRYFWNSLILVSIAISSGGSEVQKSTENSLLI